MGDGAHGRRPPVSVAAEGRGGRRGPERRIRGQALPSGPALLLEGVFGPLAGAGQVLGGEAGTGGDPGRGRRGQRLGDLLHANPAPSLARGGRRSRPAPLSGGGDLGGKGGDEGLGPVGRGGGGERRAGPEAPPVVAGAVDDHADGAVTLPVRHSLPVHGAGPVRRGVEEERRPVTVGRHDAQDPLDEGLLVEQAGGRGAEDRHPAAADIGGAPGGGRHLVVAAGLGGHRRGGIGQHQRERRRPPPLEPEELDRLEHLGVQRAQLGVVGGGALVDPVRTGVAPAPPLQRRSVEVDALDPRRPDA